VVVFYFYDVFRALFGFDEYFSLVGILFATGTVDCYVKVKTHILSFF